MIHAYDTNTGAIEGVVFGDINSPQATVWKDAGLTVVVGPAIDPGVWKYLNGILTAKSPEEIQSDTQTQQDQQALSGAINVVDTSQILANLVGILEDKGIIASSDFTPDVAAKVTSVNNALPSVVAIVATPVTPIKTVQ